MFSRPLGQWTARRFLVTLGIGGVGAYFAYLGAVDWYRGVRSDAWPTAGGSVLQSEVQRVSGRGRIKSGYKAHVLYRYEVDGRSYIGDVVSFGHLALGTGEGNAESLTHQYPRGSAVQVHYDPVRPDQAILETGWTWSADVRACLGILVIVGVFVLGGRSRGLTSA